MDYIPSRVDLLLIVGYKVILCCLLVADKFKQIHFFLAAVFHELTTAIESLFGVLQFCICGPSAGMGKKKV